MESIIEKNESCKVNVFEINSIDEFNSKYKGNNIDVLIFSATWCGPCKRLKPLLMELIVKLQKNKEILKPVTFYFINVDNCLSLSEHYKVSTIPTIIILTQTIEKYRSNEINNLDEMIVELSMSIV